jgi:hypothetical protein
MAGLAAKAQFVVVSGKAYSKYVQTHQQELKLLINSFAQHPA